MGSEWTEGTLGDVAKVQSGFAFKSGDMGETGHPVIKIKNINPPDVDVSDVQRVPASIIEANPRIEKFRLDKGDILIAMTGATVGKVGRMPAISEPHYLNQRVGKVFVTDENAADEDYVYYVLSQDGHVDQMLGLADGSAQPNISGTQIESLEVPLPPLPEQKAIAHILGTLDDKIELNRRMNATLEGMAQALFKSWFVDFDPVIDNALAAGNPIPEELAPRAEVRKKALANGTTQQGSVDHPTLSDPKSFFPAAFQFTEELGWIPGGWEVSEIENSTSTIIDHRGKTPKKLGHDWTESGIPAVSAKNIKDGKLVRKDTIKFTDSALYDRWMVDELQKGDVLMTSEAPLGEKLYLAKQVKWVLSQRLFALRANDQISGVYLYHWLNTDIAKADIDGRASGTTVQGIRQSELKKIKVLTPDAKSIGAFSNACDALMEKRATNEENTGQLTNLRDTLLPRLISGELSVSTGLEEMALAT